jgi:alkylation response protein AidB-like acyl-CoA dehydrogenase
VSGTAAPTAAALQAALAQLDSATRLEPGRVLRELVAHGLDQLPLPGSGRTAKRWQALSVVAGEDVALSKLYEGHTDALAILAELNVPSKALGQVWAVWAAESSTQRTLCESNGKGVRLRGTKPWCSGAAVVTHALVTAWSPEGAGPFLVTVSMNQPEIEIDLQHWHAVGMSRTASADCHFHGAQGTLVGRSGDYLRRPGFWQGGAGIAACWFGGAWAIGQWMRHALAGAARPADDFALAALGRVDVALQSTAALLRDASAWIDAHPVADARMLALSVRLAAEDCSLCVIDAATRALGAGALCRDARFARQVADLQVFVRQSHGQRDFAALGARLLAAPASGMPGQSSWG